MKKSHFTICGDYLSKLIKLSWSSEKKYEPSCLQCSVITFFNLSKTVKKNIYIKKKEKKSKKQRKSNQKHLGENISG